MISFEKINIIGLRISKNDLEEFMKIAQLDCKTLSEMLAISKDTIKNKKGKEKFSIQVSAKIIELVDIYSYGFKVFGDELSFDLWMFKPNAALGGLPPNRFLNTLRGIEEVKNIIGRIDYGVYS